MTTIHQKSLPSTSVLQASINRYLLCHDFIYKLLSLHCLEWLSESKITSVVVSKDCLETFEVPLAGFGQAGEWPLRIVHVAAANFSNYCR